VRVRGQTNGTTQQQWESRIRGIIKASSVFFENNVMYEVACEPSMNCDVDQQSFKAYLSRWMAASTKVAPFVGDLVSELLTTSASAAAKSCSGGDDGVTCGTKWTTGAWDNTWGVGQQMNALEVIQGLLIDSVPGPVSNNTGGISVGDPSAGTGGDSSPGAPTSQITTGDRAGAGIITAIILVGLLGGAWYVLLPPASFDCGGGGVSVLTSLQVDDCIGAATQLAMSLYHTAEKRWLHET
jgi:mannan endo-1,6-alpha-mannosidase